MSGGGKGDKAESQIKLPPEIEALAKRNLSAAERAGQIGYVPYQGPTVAALNPMQVGSMRSNYAAMNAFGVPGAVDPASAIPKPTTYAGGVQGYDPIGLYLQSLSRIHPGQRAQIGSFVSPASREATMANTVGQLRGTAKPNAAGVRAAGGIAGALGSGSGVGAPAKRVSYPSSTIKEVKKTVDLGPKGKTMTDRKGNLVRVTGPVTRVTRTSGPPSAQYNSRGEVVYNDAPKPSLGGGVKKDGTFRKPLTAAQVKVANRVAAGKPPTTKKKTAAKTPVKKRVIQPATKNTPAKTIRTRGPTSWYYDSAGRIKYR